MPVTRRRAWLLSSLLLLTIVAVAICMRKGSASPFLTFRHRHHRHPDPHHHHHHHHHHDHNPPPHPEYAFEDDDDDPGLRTLEFSPSPATARSRGPQIFNAIRDAGRQFGSSLRHNGMSVIPGIIPEGTSLYHGAGGAEVPAAFEWLAFEVEHAENFAWGGRGGRGGGRGSPGKEEEGALAEGDDDNDDHHHRRRQRPPPPPPGPGPAHGPPPPPDDDDNSDPPTPGYLHIYLTTRPLNILYLDGMAAAKTPNGTLDTQDLVLTGPFDPSTSPPPSPHTSSSHFDTPSSSSSSSSPSSSSRPKRSYFDEFARARDLCALAQFWSGRNLLDGFVRMEAGFEVILCDFSPETSGVRQVEALRRPTRRFGPPPMAASRGGGGGGGGGGEDEEKDEEEDDGGKFARSMSSFQWARAASQRYEGLGGRLLLDFSSMTSAFWFPFDDLYLSSSPPPREEGEDGEEGEEELHPRLTSATSAQLSILRRHARIATRRSIAQHSLHLHHPGRQSKSSGTTPSIQWQSLTDLIVTRYSDPLALMTHPSTSSLAVLRAEVDNLLDLFIDYDDYDDYDYDDDQDEEEVYARPHDGRKDKDKDKKEKQRCTAHHLRGIVPRTPEDAMIFAAVEATMEKICDVLFDVRRLLLPPLSSSPSSSSSSYPLPHAQSLLRDLMRTLAWSRWKEARGGGGPCPGGRPDQVLFVAMWPFGDREDHDDPRCLGIGDDIGSRHGYWYGFNRPPAPRPPLSPSPELETQMQMQPQPQEL